MNNVWTASHQTLSAGVRRQSPHQCRQQYLHIKRQRLTKPKAFITCSSKSHQLQTLLIQRLKLMRTYSLEKILLELPYLFIDFSSYTYYAFMFNKTLSVLLSLTAWARDMACKTSNLTFQVLNWLSRSLYNPYTLDPALLGKCTA